MQMEAGRGIPGVQFRLEKYTYKRTKYYHDVYRQKLIKAEYDEIVRDENGNAVRDENGNVVIKHHDAEYEAEKYDGLDYWYDIRSSNTTYKQWNGDLCRYVYTGDYENIFEWVSKGTAKTNDSGIADFGPYDTTFQPEPWDKSTKYRVTELNIPDGYYKAKSGLTQEFTITENDVNNRNDITITFENVKNKLTVTKLDIEGGVMPNVTFEILDENGDGIPLSTDSLSHDGAYNYDENGTAQQIKTNSNGQIIIGRLRPGKYIFKEIETGKEYDLYVWKTRTEPYDGIIGENTATIDFPGGESQEIIYDRKKLSVKGFVWKDTQGRKSNDYNSVYDAGEERVSSVNVSVYENGNSIPIKSTTTDENGEYELKNVIDRYNVSNYYIEFDYSGTTGSDGKTNKTCIPVAYSEEDNGSKALENSVPEGIETANPGIAYTNKNGGLEALLRRSNRG